MSQRPAPLDGLDAVPWARLTHARGSAAGVPGRIAALVALDPEVRERSHVVLEEDLHNWGMLAEATAPAVPFLVALAADPATPDRAMLLGWIGRIAEAAGDAAPRRPGDRDRPNQRATRRALIDASATWVGLLSDPDPTIRLRATEIVGRFANPTAALADAVRARVDEEDDPSVRSSAALALGLSLGASATDLDRDRLRELAEGDPEPSVRALAAVGWLWCSPAASDPDLVRSIPPLLAAAQAGLVDDPWSNLPFHRLVDRLGDRPEIRDQLIRDAVEVDDARIRGAAIADLVHGCEARRSAVAAVLPILLDRFAAGSAEDRRAIAHHLGRIGRAGTQGRSLLWEALDDPDRDVRRAAARTLAGWGDPAGVATLVDMLADSGELFRTIADCRRLGPAAAPAVPRLLELLDDLWWGDGPAHVIRALGAIGEPAAASIPDLIARFDPMPTFHPALAAALADFGPVSQGALPAIARWSADATDPPVRLIMARAAWRVGGVVGPALHLAAAPTRGWDDDDHDDLLTLLRAIGPDAAAALPWVQARAAEWDRLNARGRAGVIATLASLGEDPWAVADRVASTLDGFPTWPTGALTTAVGVIAGLGPLARSAAPMLRELADRDARQWTCAADDLATRGDDASTIDHDERLLDAIAATLGRIEA